jgi:hypothetical protein
MNRQHAHRQPSEWIQVIDRIAYWITRLVIWGAVTYLLAVILATAWTS